MSSSYWFRLDGENSGRNSSKDMTGKKVLEKVCILALLAFLVWLSFGEKCVFWLLLKNRACFRYGLGTTCSPSLQIPTAFSSSILMRCSGRNSKPRMHVSALPCVCNSRVILGVGGHKSAMMSPGRGIHFTKGGCASYHLEVLTSLAELLQMWQYPESEVWLLQTVSHVCTYLQ